MHFITRFMLNIKNNKYPVTAIKVENILNANRLYNL